MESKIVELRERTRDTVRRGRKALLIAAGVGAAVGAAAVTALVLYKVSRPATPTERFRRVLPEPWWDWIRNGRDKVELTLRRGIPPMRLYVGDQQVGEQPPSSSMEKIIIRAAQAAGTAAAAALVSRAFAQLQNRGKAA
ncbi:MAG TPA: hypothetical protein VF160_14940 [Candidatus Dormibacteraeota bacterium]